MVSISCRICHFGNRRGGPA